MESDGDHFLSYYLTQKDEDAFSSNRTAWNICSGDSWKTQTKRNPKNRSVSMSLQNREPADGIFQVTPLLFIRDCKTVKVEQEVPNEFLLLFNNEAQPPTANYKNVE